MHAKPLEIAAAVGADEVLNADDAEAIAAVQADVVIESSGSHHGLASAIKGAARGGTVVMVGLLPTGPQPVPISLAITRELELRGLLPLQRRNRRRHRRPRRRLPARSDPVITHDFPLDRGLEAFDVARNSAESGKVLLDFGRLRSEARRRRLGPGGQWRASGARPGQTPAAGPSSSAPSPRWSRRMIRFEASRAAAASPAAMASATSTCHCSARLPRVVRHQAVDGAAGQGLGHLAHQVGEHLVAGAGQQQGMELDVQLQEPGHVPGLAGVAHGVRDRPRVRGGAPRGRWPRPARRPRARRRSGARPGSAAGRRGPRRPAASGSRADRRGSSGCEGSTRMPTRLMVSTRPRDCSTRTASRTTERETLSSSSSCSASMTCPAGSSPATIRVPRCSMARWWRLVDIVVSIMRPGLGPGRPAGRAPRDHRLFMTRSIPLRGRRFPAARGNTYGLLTATDSQERVPPSAAHLPESSMNVAHESPYTVYNHAYRNELEF